MKKINHPHFNLSHLFKVLVPDFSKVWLVSFFSILVFTGCSIGGNSMLFKAIRHNDVNEAERYIAQGANVNEITRTTKVTPLYYAISKDRIDIVKLLLNNGANVNIGMLNIYNYAEVGWTPLQQAAIGNRIEIVKLLLDRKPDIDAINPYRNQTALDMAIQLNKTDVINLIRQARTKQLANIPEPAYRPFTTADLINTVSSKNPNSTVPSSTSTTSSTNQLKSANNYQEQYDIWANGARSNYSTIANAKDRSASLTNSATIAEARKFMAKAQSNMQRIRVEASNNSVTIKPSEYESISY